MTHPIDLSEEAPPTSDRKIWLWKNGDHFWAFDQEFPCYPDGDPMTIGEPIGWAWLKECSGP